MKTAPNLSPLFGAAWTSEVMPPLKFLNSIIGWLQWLQIWFEWGEIHLLKFIYCEKATKFCKILNILLTGTTWDKSMVEILQNFMTFTEYMNLKDSRCIWWILWTPSALYRMKTEYTYSSHYVASTNAASTYTFLIWALELSRLEKSPISKFYITGFFLGRVYPKNVAVFKLS